MATRAPAVGPDDRSPVSMCVQMPSRRHSSSLGLCGAPNHMGPEREREKDPWGATAAVAAATALSHGDGGEEVGVTLFQHCPPCHLMRQNRIVQYC